MNGEACKSIPCEARAALAERQAALVRALTTGEPVEGFDPDQVRRSAFALRSKRRRAAARAWPTLTAALGERFPSLFDRYAQSHSLPAAGPLADGYLFARSLQKEESLPEKAVRELLWFELTHVLRPEGRLQLRQAAFRIHAVPGGWLIGVRVPGFARVWRLRRV